MISDEVFTKEMDYYLKVMNITKRERAEKIGVMLALPPEQREGMLEAMRNESNETKNKPFKSEKNEQIELVYKFRKKYPGVVLFSVRNDGYRTAAEKSEQVAMGLWAGVSDLMCPEFKMCIEMKRVKGGIQSDKQKEFQDYIESIGWIYILAEGCEDGLQKIELHTEKNRLFNKQMPSGYVVLDCNGDHLYSSNEYDYCNDYINDCAIYEDVSSWIIRGFVLLKPEKKTHELARAATATD